jgi:hypothetical protein
MREYTLMNFKINDYLRIHAGGELIVFRPFWNHSGHFRLNISRRILICFVIISLNLCKSERYFETNSPD